MIDGEKQSEWIHPHGVCIGRRLGIMSEAEGKSIGM